MRLKLKLGQNGVAAIPVVTVLSVFVVLVGLGLTSFAINETFISVGNRQTTEAIGYATAGAQDALERIAKDKNYTCSTDDCYSIDMVANGCSTNNGCARVTVPGYHSATFGAKVDYATDSRPHGLAQGDFNADGNPDIATGNYDQSISILLSKGDGTFKPKVDYNACTRNPGGCYDIVTGDFNNDGKLDLAASSDSAFKADVLLGNGDGTFGPVASFSVNGERPRGIVTADFNNDGKLDLATGNFGTGAATGHSASVLLGNGNGTFASGVVYDAAYYTGDIAAGDFNGDGKIDLATSGTSWSNQSVTQLLGNGDGTFGPGAVVTTGNADTGRIVSADINGDKKDDLIAADDYDGTMIVLMSNGNGTFASPVAYSGGGTYAYGIFASDLNFDGKPDILVTSYNDNKISRFLNNGDGTFGTPINYTATRNTIDVITADFDNDGNLDLVGANDSSWGNAVVSVFMGNPAIIAKGRVKNNIRTVHVNVTLDPSGSGQIINTKWKEGSE